jgi:DNA-binding MarR family transcriptional regulator
MSRTLTVIRLAKVVEIVLSSVGLTVNQYRMLTFIDQGAPPMREVSTRLVMKAPNVTTLVDGLVARGLVERAHHPDDRRRRSLGLTDDGRSLLQLANDRCERALQHLAATQGSKETRLLRGVDAWVAALDDAAIRLSRDGVSEWSALS